MRATTILLAAVTLGWPTLVAGEPTLAKDRGAPATEQRQTAPARTTAPKRSTTEKASGADALPFDDGSRVAPERRRRSEDDQGQSSGKQPRKAGKGLKDTVGKK